MCADRTGRPRRIGRCRQRGFTLIEMILAIVVIGVGLAGVMLAFSTTARSSADPLVQHQMLAIAQELLEEIQFKPYAAAAHVAPTGCARDTYNDIADYHGYSTSAQVCTVDGQAITRLAGYSVSVSVTAAALGTAPAVASSAARSVAVTVTRGTHSITLYAWRTDHAS